MIEVERTKYIGGGITEVWWRHPEGCITIDYFRGGRFYNTWIQALHGRA